MSFIACTQPCLYQTDGCCTLNQATSAQCAIPNDFCINFTPHHGISQSELPTPPEYS